ncbi:MAG: DinB family protein [Chloroflexota bacterium]
MPEDAAATTTDYANQFEAVQQAFIRLLEPLTDEQWAQVGKNFPQRAYDEDERRTVGVIAHHVAVSGPYIMERIQLMAEGKPLPPPRDFKEVNAEHAAEQAEVAKDEVLKALRESTPRVSEAVRALPDDRLDQTIDTPAGPMSVRQRLERVLIGHIKMHQGSIESALSG